MTEVIRPGWISRLTFVKALSPPKARVTSDTVKVFMMTSAVSITREKGPAPVYEFNSFFNFY